MTYDIRIRKKIGYRKDAVRINTVTDIPWFLERCIKIVDDRLLFISINGTEAVSLGSIIGYDESTFVPTGWNCYLIDNSDNNLIEFDGAFYNKGIIIEAKRVDDIFPEFLTGADITHNSDGSWTIKNDFGEHTGYPGNAYWMLLRTKRDGTPDGTILNKNDESYKDYIVCDNNGNDVGLLCELDP